MRKGVENGIIVNANDKKLNLSFSEQYIIDTNNKTVEQSIEVVRKRVDESGTKEPTIQKQGQERIIVQLPGIKDPEKLNLSLEEQLNSTFIFWILRLLSWQNKEKITSWYF